MILSTDQMFKKTRNNKDTSSSNLNFELILADGENKLKRNLEQAFNQSENLSPSLYSKRVRFNPTDDSIYIIHRAALIKKLDNWLLVHLEKGPIWNSAVFITGPQGFGKSYCIYEYVWKLQKLKDFRVIYINDCAVWVNQNYPLNWLLNVIVYAFSEDEDVVNFCKKTPLSKEGLQSLFEYIAEYCNKKGYKVLAIFDQHNELTDKQRELFPFNLVEHGLPSWWRLKQHCLVVIVGSSNNSYFLKDVIDAPWPILTLCDRFSDQEFDLYVKKYLPNFNVDRLRELTSQVPHELYLIYLEQEKLKTLSSQQTVQISQQDDQYFEGILQQYSQQRATQFLDIQTTFGDKLNENNIALCRQAAIYLDLEIPVPSSDFVQLNNLLMYYEIVDNKKYIRAITSLAKEVVINYWKKSWKKDMASDH